MRRSWRSFPPPFVTGIRTCPSAHAHVRAPRSYVHGIVRARHRPPARSFVASFVRAFPAVRSGERTSLPRAPHRPSGPTFVAVVVRAHNRPRSASFVRQKDRSFALKIVRDQDRSFVNKQKRSRSASFAPQKESGDVRPRRRSLTR